MIKRGPKPRNYTLMPNWVLNAKLKAEVLGVWVHILGQREDWQVNYAYLRKHFGMGSDRVKKILDALVAHGVVEKVEKRDPQTGRWCTDWIVHDRPITETRTRSGGVHDGHTDTRNGSRSEGIETVGEDDDFTDTRNRSGDVHDGHTDTRNRSRTETCLPEPETGSITTTDLTSTKSLTHPDNLDSPVRTQTDNPDNPEQTAAAGVGWDDLLFLTQIYPKFDPNDEHPAKRYWKTLSVMVRHRITADLKRRVGIAVEGEVYEPWFREEHRFVPSLLNYLRDSREQYWRNPTPATLSPKSETDISASELWSV